MRLSITSRSLTRLAGGHLTVLAILILGGCGSSQQQPVYNGYYPPSSGSPNQLDADHDSDNNGRSGDYDNDGI